MLKHLLILVLVHSGNIASGDTAMSVGKGMNTSSEMTTVVVSEFNQSAIIQSSSPFTATAFSKEVLTDDIASQYLSYKCEFIYPKSFKLDNALYAHKVYKRSRNIY